jgi:2,4-didehydro-3-deoxy-L-rhamnonate hydrolase
MILRLANYALVEELESLFGDACPALDDEDLFPFPTDPIAAGLMVEDGIVDLDLVMEAAELVEPDCWCFGNAQSLLICPECLSVARQALIWYTAQDEEERSGVIYDWDEVKLLPPVVPDKLFCLAGNYMAHITESAGKIGADAAQKPPEIPRIFMKPVGNTLRGHGDPIPLADNSTFVDYEGEMAIVIGKTAKHVKAEQAMEYVSGITCFNDISERRLSVWPRTEATAWDRFFDWLNGKWMDGFAPIGPCVVPLADAGDIHNLALKLYLNGEVMQDANTADMIFSVPRIVEYLSSIVTLEAGDVIATGTPSGVGNARGVKLAVGDLVSVELEGVGTLSNPIIAEEPPLTEA